LEGRQTLSSRLWRGGEQGSDAVQRGQRGGGEAADRRVDPGPSGEAAAGALALLLRGSELEGDRAGSRRYRVPRQPAPYAGDSAAQVEAPEPLGRVRHAHELSGRA